jgi:hypothetical protein
MTERFDSGDTFEHKGRTFQVQYERDEDHGAPWIENDGHGPVSEWTTRDKYPGEWLLSDDRGAKRYYDFAAAVKIARKDQWGVEGGQLEGESAGEYAVRAVTKDFEYLRGWAIDEWQYVGVIVTELDADGDEGESESLWGCEDLNDYPSTVVRELADVLIARGPAPTPAAVLAAEHAANAGTLDKIVRIILDAKDEAGADTDQARTADLDAYESIVALLLPKVLDLHRAEDPHCSDPCCLPDQELADEIVLEGLTPAEQFSVDPEGTPGS